MSSRTLTKQTFSLPSFHDPKTHFMHEVYSLLITLFAASFLDNNIMLYHVDARQEQSYQLHRHGSH